MPRNPYRGTGSNGKICGATSKQTGQPCRQPAGRGTSHPGWGHCIDHMGNLPPGRKFAAREEAMAWGLENGIEVDPDDALIMMVHAAMGAVRWAADQIALEQLDDPRSPWVSVYGEERDRLARTAKLALDAGIAQRQVQIAESQGEMLAQAIREILGKLDLTADQQAIVPKVVRSVLLQLPVASGQ